MAVYRSGREKFQGSHSKNWWTIQEFEEFSTLLARIEAYLNSRPISPQSENPSDFTTLTPCHFLTGGLILAPLDPTTTETSLSVVNR